MKCLHFIQIIFCLAFRKKRAGFGAAPHLNKVKTMRLNFLDSIRGILILNMLLYHLCWDLAYIYNINIPGFGGIAGHIWQQCICCGFILLSGICLRLSGSTEKRLKNGIKIFLWGLAITFVTRIFAYDSRIIFGILTFLGSSMLITALASKYLEKIPSLFGAAACFALFFIFKSVNNGALLYGLIKLPKRLYSGLFMTYLGFMQPDFFSSDYFSLLPWIFLYLTGYFVSPFVKKADKNITDIKIPVLNYIGRHSLVFYLAHQPLFQIILTILFGN